MKLTHLWYFWFGEPPEPAALSGLTFLHSIVEGELDDGTIYASYVGTASPSHFYEGRVLSISPVNRSIPVECGLYSVGSVEVVLSNHDRYLSQRKASEAWLNRTFRILQGYPDLGISTFEPAFTGIVTDVVFETDNTVHLTITDDALGRLDRPITDVLQRVVPGGYPNESPADARPDLIPYVMGTHQRPQATARDVGQLPARRVLESGLMYAAAHGSPSDIFPFYVVPTVTEVYVYGVFQVEGVDYTLNTLTPDGGEVFAAITFGVDPRDLTNRTTDEIEVTWNGIGIDTGDGNASKPLYQLVHFLTTRCGYASSEFDMSSLSRHSGAMLDRGITGAWAIVDASDNLSDVVGEFLNSYGCRMYRTRAGKIGFSFLGTIANAAEDFRESNEIVDGSFRIQMNAQGSTASRVQVNFDWNYARQFYHRQPDINSPSEETNLRYPRRRNKSLKFVRSLDADIATPIAIGSLYLATMQENIQFPEFDVPARFFSSLELGDVITVTHGNGIGASGYVAQRIVVLSTNINADPEVSRLHIRGYAGAEPDTTVDLSATFDLTGGIEVILEAA